MTTELKERIEIAIDFGNNIQHWAKNKDSKEFKEYNSLSILLRKERLVGGCGNCANEFYQYLKHITQTKIQQTMTGQFLIGKDKNGNNRQIHCIDSNLILTDNNLTDELALQLLRTNKKFISSFKEYPKNWEELIEQDGDTGKKKKAITGDAANKRRDELMEQTKDELRSICEELQIDKSQYTNKTTKAQFVELIIAYTPV